MDNVINKVYKCRGKKKGAFYYNIERSKEWIFTVLKPQNKTAVYSPCNGLVYTVAKSFPPNDKLDNIWIRCDNSNLVAVLYYVKALIDGTKINKPIGVDDKIGYTTFEDGGRDTVIEVIDMNTREYLNPEQILNPTAFNLKYVKDGIELPFREPAMVKTVHSDKEKFEDYLSWRFGAYPSYYFVDKEKGDAFYATSNEGSYIVAGVSGTITNISSINKDGTQQFIEITDEVANTVTRIYYVDRDSIRVEIGDKIEVGAVIGKSGIKQEWGKD